MIGRPGRDPGQRPEVAVAADSVRVTGRATGPASLHAHGLELLRRSIDGRRQLGSPARHAGRPAPAVSSAHSHPPGSRRPSRRTLSTAGGGSSTRRDRAHRARTAGSWSAADAEATTIGPSGRRSVDLAGVVKRRTMPSSGSAGARPTCSSLPRVGSRMRRRRANRGTSSSNSAPATDVSGAFSVARPAPATTGYSRSDRMPRSAGGAPRGWPRTAWKDLSSVRRPYATGDVCACPASEPSRCAYRGRRLIPSAYARPETLVGRSRGRGGAA